MRRVLTLAMIAAMAVGCGKGGVDSAAQKTTVASSDLKGGALVVKDDFSSGTLDPARWNNTADATGWSVKDGAVHSPGTRNKALWLKTPLPTKVRVEFDARSDSPHGDIKVEVFGDGETHESGYILIFGGWKNRINTIARLDEHGEDRRVGGKGIKVEQGRVYKMAVVRTDGRVRWYLDREAGTLLMEYPDEAPLEGAKHAHFAFNNWSVPLVFDNVAVYDLSKKE